MPVQLSIFTPSSNLSKTKLLLIVGGIPLVIIILLVILYSTGLFPSEIPEEKRTSYYVAGGMILSVAILSFLLVFTGIQFREKYIQKQQSSLEDQEDPDIFHQDFN